MDVRRLVPIRRSGYRTLLFIKEEKIPTITSVRDTCVCREEKNGRLDPEEKTCHIYISYTYMVYNTYNNNILYDKYLIFIDRTKRIGRGVPIICITLYRYRGIPAAEAVCVCAISYAYTLDTNLHTYT